MKLVDCFSVGIVFMVFVFLRCELQTLDETNAWCIRSTHKHNASRTKCRHLMLQLKLEWYNFVSSIGCCATFDSYEGKNRVKQLNCVRIVCVCWWWSYFDRDKHVRAILFTLQCPAVIWIEIQISMGKFIPIGGIEWFSIYHLMAAHHNRIKSSPIFSAFMWS